MRLQKEWMPKREKAALDFLKDCPHADCYHASAVVQVFGCWLQREIEEKNE